MKTPTKVPSTVWLARSRMNLRKMRDVYWLDAKARATMVIEKATPATVIIELAMAVSMPRNPAAPRRTGAATALAGWSGRCAVHLDQALREDDRAQHEDRGHEPEAGTPGLPKHPQFRHRLPSRRKKA